MKKILLILIVFSLNGINAQVKVNCDRFYKIANENRILVKKDNRIGIIDTLGNFILPFDKGIEYGGFDMKTNENFVLSRTQTKFRLLSLENGKDLLTKYKDVKNVYLANNYLIVDVIDKNKKGNSYNDFILRFYLDSIGNKLFRVKEYNNVLGKASVLKDGLIRINYLEPSNRYSIFVDIKGNKVLDARFPYVSDFHDGRARVAKSINGVFYYGYIDKNGKVVIDFKFSKQPNDFSDGYARVQAKNGLFGFIDVNGNLVIEPKYKYVSDFNKGAALVWDDVTKEFKLIDKTDKVIHVYTETKGFSKYPIYFKYMNSILKEIIDINRIKVSLIKEGKYLNGVFIDKNEKIIFDKEFSKNIYNKKFENKLAIYRDYKTKKEGIVNTNGDFLLIKEESQF